MRALYPGSFDPLTNGHMDLIERANALFGDVIVAVLCNPGKRPAFSVEERISQIRSSTAHLTGVDVISFDGLTVDCARRHHADLILRGLPAKYLRTLSSVARFLPPRGHRAFPSCIPLDITRLLAVMSEEIQHFPLRKRSAQKFITAIQTVQGP